MSYPTPRYSPEHMDALPPPSDRIRVPYDIDRHPCVEHLGRMASRLRELGVTKGEFEVARITEVRGQDDRHSVVLPEAERAPVVMRGWGSHTSFKEKETGAARRLLLEMIKSKEPGTVKVQLFNGTATEELKDFSLSLGNAVVEQVQPDLQGLKKMLAKDWEFVSDLATNEHQLGTAITPRRIAVIVGNGAGVPRESQDVLDRLLSAPSDAVSVILINTPHGHERLVQGLPEPHRFVYEQNNPSSTEVMETCRPIAEAAIYGQRSPELGDVIPLPSSEEELMTDLAIDGLRAPIGIGPDGKIKEIDMTGMDSHMLILAATGAGKTTLLRALYTALGTRYGPDELEFYLLDGKSAEFAAHAPSERHPEWQPQTKVLGTNVNKDPEFVLSVVTHVEQLMEERERLFMEYGVTNYSSMRRQYPEVKLPRIVLGLDEFQVYLTGRYGDEMAKRLQNIARRGRGLALHLVMSTQDTRGMPSLWDGTGKVLFGQMGLKIAGKGGNFQDENGVNAVQLDLPARQFLVQSAQTSSRTLVRPPNASEENARPYRQAAWEGAMKRDKNLQPPRVFNGMHVPYLEEDAVFKNIKRAPGKVPEAIIAQDTTVNIQPVRVKLNKQDGRNLAVIGPRPGEVNRIMETAARSLAKQMSSEEAEFTLLRLDADETTVAGVDRTAAKLEAEGHKVRIVTAREAPLFLSQMSHRVQHPSDDKRRFLFVYGGSSGGRYMAQKARVPLDAEGYELTKKSGRVDAGVVIGMAKDGSGKPLFAPADGTIIDGHLELTNTGREFLGKIAEFGPEEGTHVVGSWSSARVMKESMPMSSVYDYHAYVALGVPETEVAHMTPGVMSRGDAAAATPKERGKFFDQDLAEQNKRPRVVVPYATGSN